MAIILSSDEIDKIDLEKETEELFKGTYDYERNTIYFPVRHHSPACSYHLKKVITEFKPEAILIEGPSDSNSLIQYLIHKESKPPIAIYYSYSDKEKVFGEKEGKYMCYYPFLEYSPEYNALKLGQELNIYTEFIDLPYTQILLNTPSENEVNGETEKKAYNNDYLIERSKFINTLCQKNGCRNFSEFWEKFYEIDGIISDTEKFIKGVLGFCILSRIGYSEEALLDEGCLQREIYMAEKIDSISKKYKKVLVVAGGFHIYGLYHLREKHKDMQKKVKEYKFKKENIGIYPIGYSFEESDQLKGYASGMPYPAFYQKVWEFLNKGKERPYEESITHFLVAYGSTITDKIEALNMCKGLANIREKQEAGVFELIDAAKTCFIKGELNVSENEILKAFKNKLRGNQIGSICDSEQVPPILKDFRTICERFKIKINTTAMQEVTLDIYKNKRHREISMFLHSLNFLNINFAEMVAGPDFIARKNTNLIREIWKYSWSSNVESNLIEISVYGTTIKTATVELCLKRFDMIENSSKEACILLIKAVFMGLTEEVKFFKSKMLDILSKDESFMSVAYCTYNLSLISNRKEFDDNIKEFDINIKEFDELMEYAYSKAVSRIFTLDKVNEKEEDIVIGELKNLYNLIVNGKFNKDIFVEALLNLINGECNPALEGAVLGILNGLREISRENILERAKGYFYGSGEKMIMSSRFMKGLFSTARDMILYDARLLKGIDNLIRNLDEESFLNILPNMRLSFSFFAPQEIAKISEIVSKMYKKDANTILYEEGVDPIVLKLAKEADDYAVKLLKRWGLYDE